MINGHWFEAGNSTRFEASLFVDGASYSLRVGDAVAREGALEDVTVSDRIGTMARKLSWSDGAVFETTDNNAVDAALKGAGHRAARSLFIHAAERSWRWVGVGVVVVVGVAVGTFTWGLPTGAKHAAEALPVSAHEKVSSGTMATLDRLLLNPSTLGKAEKGEIKRRFEALAAAVPSGDFTMKLHFRSMRDIPNAFALPGGDVIVTDALVNMIEHPDELDSILLHELGHVIEHHGMQRVIQASAISVGLSLILGDLSGLGELAVGMPVFLLQSNYSRAGESEADEFAFRQMGKLGKDPKHFANIMLRMTRSLDPESPDEQNTDTLSEQRSEDVPKAYLSSHPDSRRRALRALEVSRELGF